SGNETAPGRTFCRAPQVATYATLHLLVQGLEELGVLLCLGEAGQHELRPLTATEHGDHPAHRPNLAQRLLAEEELLSPGAGALDIDRRVEAALGQLAIEVELHVAGTLELLVDHVIHAATGVDQTGGDDGEAAPALDVAGGTEESLRRIEGDRVNTTGQCAATRRHGEVVRTGQAGNRVEQDRHVTTGLD